MRCARPTAAPIGVEYMYTTDQERKSAGGSRSSRVVRPSPSFSAEQKKRILERLTAAEGLERYLHTEYVGQKRFSLEGGERFIAAMDELIRRRWRQGRAGSGHRHGPPWSPERAGQHPGQDAKDLFAEFERTAPEDLPAGDVKYHHGFQLRRIHSGRPSAT